MGWLLMSVALFSRGIISSSYLLCSFVQSNFTPFIPFIRGVNETEKKTHWAMMMQPLRHNFHPASFMTIYDKIYE